VIDACFGILLDEDAWLGHIYGITVYAACSEVKLEVRSAEKPARRSVRLSVPVGFSQKVCPPVGYSVGFSQKVCPPAGSVHLLVLVRIAGRRFKTS
jgi:hypothetical protein